jgi:hypothetical protein
MIGGAVARPAANPVGHLPALHTCGAATCVCTRRECQGAQVANPVTSSLAGILAQSHRRHAQEQRQEQAQGRRVHQ